MDHDKPKRVTTQHIAERAGVSKATVSYAMNGTGSVSPETVKRIHAIAEELGYQENRLAKATRTGKSHSIGLVLPDLRNPFFPQLAQAVVQVASQKGYSVLLVDAINDYQEESNGIRRLTEYAIDGLIWCPIDDDATLNNNINCPVVVIDRPISGFDSVYANSYKGGQLQADLLREYGHKLVGVISGPERSPSATMRRQGFYQNLAAETTVEWDIACEYSIDLPAQVIEKTLESGVTCVVTANDTQAIGLSRALYAANKRVPDDISIIGFDNIDWSELTTPPLTTIKLPIKDIGISAFEQLMLRLDNKDSGKRDVVLDVSVEIRGSLKHLNQDA